MPQRAKSQIILYSIAIFSIFSGAYSLSAPLLITILSKLSASGITPITTSPLESLTVRLYLASILSIAALTPFAMAYIYQALYPKERKIFMLAALPLPIAFTAGASASIIFLQNHLNYFILSQSFLGENTTVSLLQYLYFLGCVGVISGALTCYPIILYSLSSIGLITSHSLKKYRRHTIVFSFLIGALITPPDIISQICVSIPLIFLHETGITAIKIKERSGYIWKQTPVNEPI